METNDATAVRAIMKRTSEMYGHTVYIAPTLKELQRLVGGYIETVTLRQASMSRPSITLVIDKEGKLKSKKANFHMGVRPFGDTIVGDVLVCSFNLEGELVDLDLDFRNWKAYLERMEAGT